MTQTAQAQRQPDVAALASPQNSRTPRRWITVVDGQRFRSPRIALIRPARAARIVRAAPQERLGDLSPLTMPKRFENDPHAQRGRNLGERPQGGIDVPSVARSEASQSRRR